MALSLPLSGWLRRSVRHKLLAMALGPLVVVFPLLVLALTLWGNAAYDRLLITKVRSDLAVARGYFDKVLGDVSAGTQTVAESHRLQVLLAGPRRPPAAPQTTGQLLADERLRLGLDFLRFQPLGDQADALPHLPAQVTAGLRADTLSGHAQLVVMDADALTQMAPDLAPRLPIALVPTPNAAQTDRTRENRAMVALSVRLVRDDRQRPLGLLAGGVLLNQNLGFIDHINRIVYPEGSLPFGSQGTATLFLDDVRITTNVRLFQDQRAIGTRVSHQVREAVLGQGHTWLDRAFVVNDWYVSAYEPLMDADEQRIGMLYVGFLEQPFRWVRFALLGVMALIFLVAMALAALFSLRWARSIFQPVEQMNRTMQRVEDGDGAARVGPLATQDELGALAGHLDQLLDRIAEKTEALERWGRELDARVAERTAELAASHESLKQAQQQLVKSEKLAVIGQLAASVAHEINNPIAVMQGNLDLMRDTLGTAADPVRPEMRLLDEQVERMRLIVQQLLQHARPEEYAGYIEPLDVNDTLRACLVLVNHRLAQTQVRVVLSLQATQRVACNRQELQQVVINLLINAVAAMPEGGTLSLSTRDRTDPAGACIDVQDSGPGLSDAVRQRLFQPFFTTRRDGNGLGLWISQGLVERYGGHIAATNRTDGPGAVFSVCLLTEVQGADAPNNS
jgi:signal transduction histidine kinase